MTTLTEHAADLDLGADRAITLRLDVATGAELAKADPDLVTGLAVVKPGTFNGSFVVEESDLHAWADRFAQLAGTFRPPLRADHSFSVESVLGRFVGLRVEARSDATVGGADVPMLVGDVRLVGTAAEKAATRERILSGKYDERSSEFYPYRTNAGVEYPSVFAGAAFVDIPAVEGLGAITLRRGTLAIDRNTEQGDGIVPETTEPIEDAATEPITSEPTTEPTTVEDPTVDAPAEEPAPVEDAPVVGDDPEPDPDEDEQPVGEVPGGTDLRAVLRAAGVDMDEVTLRRVAHAAEALAQRRTEFALRMDRFTTKGVIPVSLRSTAEALLTHDDARVRDGFAAYLDHARPPVALGATAGTRTSVAPGGARDGHITLTMSREEVETTYEAATPEQRRTYLAAELAAWQDNRPAQS